MDVLIGSLVLTIKVSHHQCLTIENQEVNTRQLVKRSAETNEPEVKKFVLELPEAMTLISETESKIIQVLNDYVICSPSVLPQER